MRCVPSRAPAQLLVALGSLLTMGACTGEGTQVENVRIPDTPPPYVAEGLSSSDG